MKLVRERVAGHLQARGPVPVWQAIEHAILTGQTVTLTQAQMHEALADNAYLVLKANDLAAENIRLREQLRLEEMRRT